MSGGMGITRQIGTSSIPVWQGTDDDIQILQGGCLLDITGLTLGMVVPAGTPVIFSESTRVATVLHTATAQANASGSAVNYKVLKGHNLIVGDNLASGSIGGKAFAITDIDTTNADYDLLTVGTTIGAVTTGDLLFASTATGATASALPAVNGLTYDDTVVASGNSLSIVIRGTVYARRVVYSAAIAALTGLKNIIYSQSL